MHRRPKPEPADVEIVLDTGTHDILMPRALLINGTDAGLMSSDGVQIDVGHDRPTTITLTLIPKTIRFRTDDGGD